MRPYFKLKTININYCYDNNFLVSTQYCYIFSLTMDSLNQMGANAHLATPQITPLE